MEKTRIMLVEDEAITALCIRDSLESLGYELIATISRGTEAVWQAAKLRPDLILMDITLADEMNGIEAAELIRQEGQIPIIFMTAHTDSETLARAKRAEPFGYLTKPYQLDNLKNTIEVALFKSAADARVRESEMRYRLLFQTMRNGFALHEIICDPAGRPCDYRFIEVNPAFEAMTGLQAREIIGKRVREILPGTEEEWIDRFGAVALSGLPVHFENFSAELGRHFEVQAYAPQPGRFATIITDITERKTAQLERSRTEATLLASEARYKKLSQEFETIVNGIPDALTLWSAEMRLLWANKGACEQFKQELPELLGKNCEELCGACHGSRQGCDVRRSFRSETIENKLQTDPEGRTWGVKAFPLLDNSGTVTQVIRLASDLTERMHLREEAARSAHLAALGELAAGVAHEINNPTGLILLEMPMLRDAFRDARPILEEHFRQNGNFPFAGMNYSEMRGEIEPMIIEISEGALRIKRIVSELKDFSRPVEGNPFVAVDLNEVVRKANNLLAGRIRKMTDAFSIDYAAAAVLVPGNFQKLEQVIINLIINAGQALTARSAAVTVKISTAPQRGIAIVTIRDEGMGIRPEHLQVITDPFFTTRRESGGTGLGLSVSMRIVEEHGGTLRFDSTLSQGTLVTLELPLWEPWKTPPS